jgi:electron transport complex protein RnfD
MICFPAAMGVWLEPGTLARVGDASIDGVTMATPLAAAADPTLAPPPMANLFFGNVAGCVGETSALAALIGGLYLVFRRVADWRQPLGVLGAAVVFAAIAHWAAPDKFAGPLFHLNSGALMFGAFFIATDYVGAPITPWGRLIFGIGVGALVMLIRLFGAYPEGVMFAILIMNSVTPLIERWTVPTPFGGHATA